jgi:hypothetical protein
MVLEYSYMYLSFVDSLHPKPMLCRLACAGRASGRFVRRERFSSRAGQEEEKEPFSRLIRSRTVVYWTLILLAPLPAVWFGRGWFTQAPLSDDALTKVLACLPLRNARFLMRLVQWRRGDHPELREMLWLPLAHAFCTVHDVRYTV